MASVPKLSCIYLALILHDNAVTLTEDKTKAFIKAAGVNLICEAGAGGPALAADAAPAEGPAPTAAAAPAEVKTVEAKNEESDDDMGFGLFD
ncbi:60S acidic ribosomal protein P1 [Tupaia chinensis]|uniref:60S acidic ribosomal protein P1 n=1 Tax=Tupaia chinensis TaxID=246437 RepID=L9KWE4_TUPCH|nr:60S acidic ribosomal protein P1 [Tupaia chinensis]